jgi:hypothetical protein
LPCSGLATGPSAGIGPVHDRSVADSQDPNRPPVLSELIEDPIGTDAKRPEATEPTPKTVTGLGLPLQNAKRFHYRVSQMPVEVEDLPAGSPGKDDLRQLPTGSFAVQLVPELVEGEGLALLHLAKAFLDGGERLSVRENLGGLLERLVLVDGNEHGRRAAPPGHDDVLPHVGHAVDEPGEGAAKLSYRNRLSHGTSVPQNVHNRGKVGRRLFPTRRIRHGCDGPAWCHDRGLAPSPSFLEGGNSG